LSVVSVKKLLVSMTTVLSSTVHRPKCRTALDAHTQSQMRRIEIYRKYMHLAILKHGERSESPY
jgi:hypothetical protein